MTLFLQKDGKRKEVEVLKRLERGRDKVWLVEKKPQLQQEKGRGDDEQTREMRIPPPRKRTMVPLLKTMNRQWKRMAAWNTIPWKRSRP